MTAILNPPPESYGKIEQLVKNFTNSSHSVKDWNEEDTKVSYITPLFEALGWDVYNQEGSVGNYREVHFETSVKVKSSTKLADYSFYLGKLLFHVEAKKPCVDIKKGTEQSFQIRSYGWSSGCVLGVLTDFEELAIYRCSKKPKSTDKAHVERAYYYTYDKYLENWGEIYSLLSKPAIKQGALEKFAEHGNIGKGEGSVDKEFLKTIEEWRKRLATHIALKNNIEEAELNYAAQKIIDRLIFLRICEDRSIEPSEQLKDLI